MEAVQARHQPIGGKGEVGSHLQHLVLVLGSDGAQAAVDALQAGLHLFEQLAAGLGQFDATVDAVEQPGAELFLQPLDLLADGRLGGAQLHCRGGKAALARRRLEYAEQVQGQVAKRFIHKPCLS